MQIFTFCLLCSVLCVKYALCEEEVQDLRNIVKSGAVVIKNTDADQDADADDEEDPVVTKATVKTQARNVEVKAKSPFLPKKEPHEDSNLDKFINSNPQALPIQSAPLTLQQPNFPLNPGIPPSQGLLNSAQIGAGLPPAGFGLPGSLPVSSGVPQQGNGGLLGVLNNLGRQLTGAVGLNNLLPAPSQQLSNGPQIPRIPSSAGRSPLAGLPNVPGLPLLPGATGPNGQIDFLNLFSAISRRAFNGSSLSDLIPPTQAQKFADNITDTLLPSTAVLDLSKFMGRWFEGINSPRATDQRCVVHHYGGLTENGKTATYTALKIYREGSEFGQVRYSIGYAFRGGRQGGMQQMHSSEATDPTPYWIYRVGPVGKDPFGNDQYEYAVVSNWIRYPVMVLVRDPDRFRQKHEEEVLRWLEDNQFINGFTRAFNLVQPSDYANCQYADSTFEIFG